MHGVCQAKLAVSVAVALKFGFRSAVQKQLSVAVSGSLASSVSLHVLLIGTGVDVPPEATSPMLTAVLLIAVLLSVTVQLNSAVPPVFWATYCTVSASAATLVPFTVKAFQPRHDAVPSSLFDSKPTSMNGPAPHLICLSAFTLHVSHVSCAVAVSFFRAEGFAGSTEPTISHVTVAVSGSAAASVAEHAALFAPDVNTHAPLTHVPCALPQSTSATHAPASDPTLTVPGNPGLPSPIEQFRRSAVPALPTT